MTAKKYLLLLCPIVLLSSCGSTKFAISTGDENLSSLTKVTDNEEPCINPYGGDNGKNLFYAACENSYYYNIFKKENAFSASVIQKTSGKNINTQPAYNAVIDRIAFRCQNEGSRSSDIYTMSNGKGTALSPITESYDDFEGHPSFSPEGNLIAYERVAYTYARYTNTASLLFGANNTLIIQNSDIWIKNLKTGENTLLGKGYQPRFSPDGKRIAYVKYSSDAKSCNIWIMETDGSNTMQITDAKQGYAFNPCWSPDGTKILFESFKKDKKDFDLYVIDLEGNNLKQLTKNKSYDGTPYWTTDNYIYFTSDRGGKSGKYQIWRFKYYD